MLLRCILRPMLLVSPNLPRPVLASTAPTSLRGLLPGRIGGTSLFARPLPVLQHSFEPLPYRLRRPGALAGGDGPTAVPPLSLLQLAALDPSQMQAAKKQRLAEPGKEGGGPKQQKRKQQRKNPKPLSPEKQARAAIHMAARANDLPAALAVFDRAKADGVKLGAELYVILLYLCSGGDAWERQLQQAQQQQQQQTAAQGSPQHAGNGTNGASGEQQEAVWSAAAAEAATAVDANSKQQQQAPQLDSVQRHARAQQLFTEMRQSEGQMAVNEMCYTALARLAAATGDADKAFALAQEMIASGIAPKLRSFTPALIAYAEAGDCAKAFEVDAAIAAHQLDLGESEFGWLAHAAAAGGSWQTALGVLRRMGAELTTLQPATLERLAALFASPAGADAFQEAEGGGRWQVGPAAVDEAGCCSSCGGSLAALDLSPSELQEFAAGIAAIAERQERRPNDFQQFKAWLEEHGPFGAVIDGANVALFGQNFESGGFNFGQIRMVQGHLASQHPDLKPLLLLHVGRTKAPQARTPAAQALMNELSQSHSFYTTPAGSNDDWYWIYAAVTAGVKGLLISNDEMRDHIFQLLAPKYFMKWKQRHQVKYRFTLDGLELDYPAPYTTCTQELECGSWLFPGADGRWLCAQRLPGTTVEAAGAALEEDVQPVAKEAD